MPPPKTIRLLTKIEKLKKALRREKARFGGYHDGAGYRYAIAELYFELKDYKKTNRYLNWFDKNFPDDRKFSFYVLGEAVTKFELKKISEAKRATIELNQHNTYLIDLLLSNEISDQHKYEWMELESLSWARQQLPVHLNLTTTDYLDWLRGFRQEESYENWYNKYISILQQLKGMKVSEERNKLLAVARDCLKDWRLA